MLLHTTFFGLTKVVFHTEKKRKKEGGGREKMPRVDLIRILIMVNGCSSSSRNCTMYRQEVRRWQKRKRERERTTNDVLCHPESSVYVTIIIMA